eukprot:m.47062 g.47062  ORF g.47062 m.47062 type:complete len:316 (-) comp20404_c0_seq1:57-1004(-)
MGNTNSSVDNIQIQLLTTDRAEQWLMWDEAHTGDFLVRKSRNGHTLSVRSAPKVVNHFAIIKDEFGKFSIGDAKGTISLGKKPSSVIGSIQADSIEALVVGYLKGGPHSKLAFEHFGCFLIRMASPPPLTATSPPAFFFASTSGFGAKSRVLSGKSSTNVVANISPIDIKHSSSLTHSRDLQSHLRKSMSHGSPMRTRSNTTTGSELRTTRVKMSDLHENHADDADTPSRHRSNSLDFDKMISRPSSGVWGGSDDGDGGTESQRSSGVWLGSEEPESKRASIVSEGLWKGEPDRDSVVDENDNDDDEYDDDDEGC